MSRRAKIVVHTSSDIEFEVIDADTGEVLYDRSFWCEEGDEEAESAGWAYFRKGIAQRGWTLAEEVWS